MRLFFKRKEGAKRFPPLDLGLVFTTDAAADATTDVSLSSDTIGFVTDTDEGSIEGSDEFCTDVSLDSIT